MATGAGSTALDAMFALIEDMNVPAGYRAEIIEGRIVLNPHSRTHSTIIRMLTRSIEDARGLATAKVLWDVRMDFPGSLNGFAPDVALVADAAEHMDNGDYHYSDAELVAEVVSPSSHRDDYDTKLKTYAAAEVPTYVIADPKTGCVHVHHDPKDGEYQDVSTYAFGMTFTLPFPDITIDTTLWPRD
ncbi:Uma2 family endonuclease [Streptomyces sp. NPDC003077]|uniref:Uma2 family endonuclease n=1 Tax=Streptomyces sp. NPDC003077 TaxID=3154443 RepID=UPI0033B5A8EF